MARICNFPISETERCRQPVADDRPNCGRHHCEISADQLGWRSTVYEKDGELHVWAGNKPDGLYCLIHSDPAYQTLYQVAGQTPPYCLNRTVAWEDEYGDLHRDDGPAFIEPDGTQRWFQRGKLHREDGPAMVMPNGAQAWLQHGKLHRDDGPAEIWPGGTQYWYWHGRPHRDDGPAMIWPNGTRKWYWHGEEVTEEEHARLREQSLGI